MHEVDHKSEPASGASVTTCPICGRAVEQPAKGRRRVYDRGACRFVAFRQRHKDSNKIQQLDRSDPAVKNFLRECGI